MEEFVPRDFDVPRRLDTTLRRRQFARLLAVETSDQADGIADLSFCNVLRAGFQEAYRQQWWHPPDPPHRLGQNS